MKIWIDLTNSPHVNFFAAMIEELQREHEVLLTCRPLSNTIDLLETKGFEYHVVGKHYGANKVKKGFGFPLRVFQLCRFLRKSQIDVAISHSSFYSPVVARLLGIRSIYLNDNEHAAGNKISFLFANTIMVPEYLGIEKVVAQWGNKEKIIQYPGVKEGVYLWKQRHVVENPGSQNEGLDIYVRPEPWTAQYYTGKRNFMDDFLIDLKEKFRVVLLPRDDEQKRHYASKEFAGLIIPENTVSLSALAEKCDLFIGAGGTMTREAAVLGIPTISVYQDELLAVDKYLIDQRYMIHKKQLTMDFVVKFLNENRRSSPRGNLMSKGRTAFDLIEATLLDI